MSLHGLRRFDPRERPDLLTEDRRARARRRRRDRDERGEVRERHADAPELRRDRGAVREGSDRLLGDGVQAEPHALGADQQPRAIRPAGGGEMEDPFVSIERKKYTNEELLEEAEKNRKLKD